MVLLWDLALLLHLRSPLHLRSAHFVERLKPGSCGGRLALLERHSHCASVTSSARDFFSMPQRGSTSCGWPIFDASNFRGCANPFLSSSKNFFSSILPFLKGALPSSAGGISRKCLFEMSSTAMIAESTLGGGENDPALTVSMYFGVPYALTLIERMLSLLSEATMRFATSF